MTASTLFLGCQRGGSTVAHLVLPSGAVALIDDADAPLLADACWWEDPRSNTSYVRGQRRGETTKLRLHRVIAGATAGDIVDHINLNGLDCRRANLRFATMAENSRNRPKQNNNTTGFKGVTLFKGRFQAHIKYERKKIHLGCFATAEEAHAAYADAAARLHGQFARAS